MGRLRKLVKSVTPAHIVAAVVSPVGAIAAGAKLLAPKSSVTDIIATASPTGVPLIQNTKIKTAAIVGYSTAAIIGGGMVAANAAAGAGVGAGGQGAAGLAASAGTTKAIGAGMESDSVASYLAGQDPTGQGLYGESDLAPTPDYDPDYEFNPAEEPGGFNVSNLIKGGQALLGLTGKKKVTGGAAAATGPGPSFASMFASPINILLFLTGGAVLYFFYKKAVR